MAQTQQRPARDRRVISRSNAPVLPGMLWSVHHVTAGTAYIVIEAHAGVLALSGVPPFRDVQNDVLPVAALLTPIPNLLGVGVEYVQLSFVAATGIEFELPQGTSQLRNSLGGRLQGGTEIAGVVQAAPLQFLGVTGQAQPGVTVMPSDTDSSVDLRADVDTGNECQIVNPNSSVVPTVVTVTYAGAAVTTIENGAVKTFRFNGGTWDIIA